MNSPQGQPAKFTDKELETLADVCRASQLSSGSAAYSYAVRIPRLVRKILELRREVIRLQEFEFMYKSCSR